MKTLIQYTKSNPSNIQRRSPRFGHLSGLSRTLAGALILAVGFATSATAQDLTPDRSVIRGDGKRVVTFSTVASGTWTIPNGVTEVEVLVVGGGGAGARSSSFDSPGGGAGGLYYSTNWSVTPGASVGVTVGAGAPTTTVVGDGANGQNSVFGSIIAYGGEGAIRGETPPGRGGNQGGRSIDNGVNITPGFLGGTGNGAKGGAGAGEDGRNGGYSPAYGGAGVVVPITGTGPLIGTDGNPISGSYGNMIGYAGGGSAGFDGKELGAERGESYGGGSGSDPEGTAGTPGFNTLGGGGGGGRSANGGGGGSGVVIIAYNDPSVLTYTVTFVSNGGSAVDPQIVAANGFAVPPTAPTRTGFIFDGWFSDSELSSSYNFQTTPVTANITLYAKWLTGYTVTFNSNGGSAVSPQIVAVNTTATEPPVPTLTGYTFNGWYSDIDLTLIYDFQTPVTANITLYAYWEINTFTLTYTAGTNGSISGDSPQTVDYSASGTPVTAVADSGFIFLKWSDNSVVNPRTDSNVTANINVTAEFIPVPTIVTVPEGLNPGDQYRLVFVSSTTTTAENSDPAYYNNLVNTLANNVPALAALGTTWTTLGNFNGVTPPQNTGTTPGTDNPPIPTYRLDGVRFANSYTDIYDANSAVGSVSISVNELGVENTNLIVWTGTDEASSAAVFGSNFFGATNVGHGLTSDPYRVWGFFSRPNTQQNHLYGISGVLTVGGGVTDPFDEWSGSNGYNLVGGKEGDDDGDGFTNFEEFAFGLDPTSSASVNPISVSSELKSGGTFSFTRTVDSNLNYSVWVSTDLVDWGSEPVLANQEAGPVVDGVETVIVTLPSIPTEAKLFVRVKAE